MKNDPNYILNLKKTISKPEQIPVLNFQNGEFVKGNKEIIETPKKETKSVENQEINQINVPETTSLNYNFKKTSNDTITKKNLGQTNSNKTKASKQKGNQKKMMMIINKNF